MGLLLGVLILIIRDPTLWEVTLGVPYYCKPPSMAHVEFVCSTVKLSELEVLQSRAGKDKVFFEPFPRTAR